MRISPTSTAQYRSNPSKLDIKGSGPLIIAAPLVANIDCGCNTAKIQGRALPLQWLPAPLTNEAQ